ncbi:MAG: HD domain-containing protein, partial [Armatimonadota bacterium]
MRVETGAAMIEGLITKLEALVQERLEDWPPTWERYHWPGYTYDHTLRVRNLAVVMAREEGAHVAVVELAAILHDIAKDAGDDHGAAGAREAEGILRAHDVGDELIGAVCSAIETHTGKNTPEHPIENLLLGDADLIDANFGLVATWRFITIRAGHETPLPETIESMAEWLPRKDALMEKLLTETGMRIARERSARLHDFGLALREGVEGEPVDDGSS